MIDIVWLTSHEAARYLRVHVRTIQSASASGALQSEQRVPGGRRRFRREWLDAYAAGDVVNPLGVAG